MAFSLIGLMLLLLFVIAPFIAGVVLVMRSRFGGKGYPACGGCGYNVGGSVGKTELCPECGVAFIEAGILPPGGRSRPRLKWLGVALIGLSFMVVVLSFLASLPFRYAVQSRQAAQVQVMAAQVQALKAQQQQLAQSCAMLNIALSQASDEQLAEIGGLLQRLPKEATAQEQLEVMKEIVAIVSPEMANAPDSRSATTLPQADSR